MSGGADELVRDAVAGGREATVRAALAQASRRFEAVGCDTPRLDAELLLAEVLGCDRAGLFREPERRLGGDEVARFETFVRRREAREPVAYLLGRKGFRHIELHIDERVLVPRVETELLVELGLEFPRGARVVDVGTGSGCVALALKHERPDLEILGVDAQDDALAVARENAERLALDVTFMKGDLLHGVEPGFHGVLANLPYIDADELDHLDPELSIEPRTAVVAEEHGLALNRRLVGQLDGTPLVGLEVGRGQAAAVREIVGSGFPHVETRHDLMGIERLIIGRRS